MGTPVESHLDDLALQTKIDDYGDMLVVTIPGVESLSPEERLLVTQKAQQLYAGSKLQADILQAALRDVTPPVDEQAELDEARRFEAESRQELKTDGCPPCYPPGLDVRMLRNPPEECRAIVAYWQSFPGADDVPLTAQFNAWREFRVYQRVQRIRHRLKLKDLEQEIRKRRQRHRLDGHDYQLARLEEFERKRDELNKKMAVASADNIYAITQRIGSTERDIKRHMVLLDWIEQQRQSMMHHGGTATTSSRANSNVQQRTFRHVKLRKRAQNRPKARVPGRARGPEPDPAATENSHVIPKGATVQRRPGPRSAKQSIRTSQKVVKRRHRSAALASPPETVTRSGRISKPPHRWVPE